MTYDEIIEEIASIEEQIIENNSGCGDDEDGDMCEYGSLCDSCRSWGEGLERDRDTATEKKTEKEEEIFIKFAKFAKKMGYDECAVYEALKNNAKHNGRTAEDVLMEAWYPEMVERTVGVLEYTRARHEDTDYDTLLAGGMSKDMARIAMQ